MLSEKVKYALQILADCDHLVSFTPRRMVGRVCEGRPLEPGAVREVFGLLRAAGMIEPSYTKGEYWLGYGLEHISLHAVMVAADGAVEVPGGVSAGWTLAPGPKEALRLITVKDMCDLGIAVEGYRLPEWSHTPFDIEKWRRFRVETPGTDAQALEALDRIWADIARREWERWDHLIQMIPLLRALLPGEEVDSMQWYMDETAREERRPPREPECSGELVPKAEN